MKRLFFLLMMVAVSITGIHAQIESGQRLWIKNASGDSIQTDLAYGITFSVKGNEITWNFGGDKLKNVESVEFTPDQKSLEDARQALIDFYKAMDGDNWINNTNWCSNKPIDEWYGITTLGRPYVFALYLPENNLKGKIPSDFFTKAGPMASFRIPENQVSGKIPADYAKNLDFQHFNVSYNKMNGRFPSKVFDLDKLMSFYAQENQFTGTIPSGITKLMDDMYRIDISGNDLSGDVPEEVLNHKRFHLCWDAIIPQGGHLNMPVIPAYKLDASDLNGNHFNTTDIYKSNTYTLLFNYESASEGFMNKLKKAYNEYKGKGFEVLGLCPGDPDEINTYLYANGINWMNLDPITFISFIGRYFIFLNYVNLVDQNGNIVFSSIMDENGKMEDTWGSSTRDMKLFDVLADKYGKVDFSPYTSTEYSQDGKVITLQKATEGKGVDIVFMGNGFVDKDMNSGGKYEQCMKDAMEQFFVYEPLKSLRNRFNVYAVKAVSANAEMFEGTSQAINSATDALEYAQKVKELIADRPMHVNVIANAYNAGRSITNMYDDNSYVAFMNSGVNRVLNHEAGGHGFGRLFDEYVENMGEAPESVKDNLETVWKTNGRGANIDMHSDIKKTRWAHLAADSRYAEEDLGAYEGGGTFEKGIYRPTPNSMMYYNDLPFNAPSREAIYKYVMQESEGSGWVYDLETFIEFDKKGREQFVEALHKSSQAKKYIDGNGQHPKEQIVKTRSLPPVFVKGTWRDAVNKATTE